MNKKLLLLLFVGILSARSRANVTPPANPGIDRPRDQIINQTVGEAWNWINNFGNLGGEFNQALYGLSWPGGAAVNNYYLWGSYFTIGAVIEGTPYVTYGNYPVGDWTGSDNPPIYVGPGKSPMDVVVAYDDFKDNPRHGSGSHLGVKVIIRSMQWPHEPFNDFVAYEIYITYDASQCDIPGHGDVLNGVFVGMWYDCDVSGADQTEPHIDDLVAFDGWTNGEWPLTDDLTLLPDSFIPQPDGVPDEYIIWGDEPGEVVLDSSIAVDYVRNDTTYKVYIFPRGMSYIYDGDNPADPGDDTGEGGKSAGYIGGMWLYTPPSPSDSTLDNARFVRPWSHQWWNWSSDPATPTDVYDYLRGHHSATMFYRYAPHPFDLGAPPFDYRFLNTVGPFSIRSGDTLKLVWVAGVGQGLSGGYDSYWGRGWLPGVRQVLEKALQAYYAGSTHSDPAHPSDPDEDLHWRIPVPPPSPMLVYTVTSNGIKLVWDDLPERTPDPLKGYPDMEGYIVYRAVYQPINWVVLDTIRRNPDGSFNHTYLDSTAVPGFQYYYVVTAYDEDSLESSKNNYLKDENGNPVYITMKSKIGRSVDDVKVVPNPYNGSAPWTATEIADKVEFINLPSTCRITIYTLSGHKIKTLENKEGKGSLAWNLLSDANIKVQSGIYIYKVETPDGDYKIGKLVILK